MRLIIVGGGKVAYNLIKTLPSGKKNITVIEQEFEECERLADELDVQVFHGDGTNREILEHAGCEDADVLVAVTGRDEDNLIACQLAKIAFKVKNCVARVNNPKNMDMFIRMGVDKVYCGTQIVADIIEQEIEYEGMRLLYRVPASSKLLVEFLLSKDSNAVGKTLQEYNFVGESKVVFSKRSNGAIEMPTGALTMLAGDTMVMVCDDSEQDRIWKTMVR